MKLTIFTPLYNRADMISRIYDSLKKQKVSDFEWIVVDDGSTDHPEILFDKWSKENNCFGITFIQTENGGKHRAVNKGVEAAKGDYFLICDSDDYLVDNCLELVYSWIDEIHDTDLIGIAGLRCTEDGRLLLWKKLNDGSIDVYGGKPSYSGFIDVTPRQALEYGLFGDKVEILRTDIMKQYPFPEFEGEKFLTEMIVWNQIDKDGGNIRYYDKPLEIGEYCLDGLTQNGMTKFINNPKGYGLYLQGFPESEKKQKFCRYYLQLKDRISEAEIAQNLGETDCENLKTEALQMRLNEIAIIRESLPVLANIRNLMSQTDPGTPGFGDLLQIHNSIRSLLESKLMDKTEVTRIWEADINLLSQSLNEEEQRIASELR